MTEQQHEPTLREPSFEGIFDYNAYARTFGRGIDSRHAIFSSCHLQAYQTSELGGIVVATEISDNDGMSITNAAGWLAEEVCRTFQLLPERTTFIEHYTPNSYKNRGGEETWDMVYHEWDGLTVKKTVWRRMGKDEVDKLLS